MNEIFLSLGIESWKPVLSALLLPPVPLLLLTLFGARLMFWRRGLGWLLIVLAVLGLWLASCSAAGEWLQKSVLSPPPALSADRIADMRKAMASGKGSIAVVVLGGGREASSPEYGVASLSPLALERLRYGIWLGRDIGAPVMYSGGLAHAAEPGAAEAEIAAEIATREFMRPLRWAEPRARDTRENAQFSTAMLKEQGIQQVVVVTHGWHMPRALRAFKEAAQRNDAKWEIVAAPMGLARRVERPALRWMPSGEGFMLVRSVLREKLGWWLGS
ncbi:MAG: YdcF family protein [Aquincola sp.]|nr:YdcF family protein [Aquincola sp.]MDH4287475.1 YdcF family protein [Aquincola sp.]MDH5330474.1 YdcF family protein [Aquincola sp.]